MSAGSMVRIIAGRLRGKLAEVLAVGPYSVTVRGSFGTETFGHREVAVLS